MGSPKKITIVDLIRFAGLIKQFIGPAVELVEMLKEAFKSKERKFIEMAVYLFGDANAADEAEKIVADAIRRLGIGIECLSDPDAAPAVVLDCFVRHVNTEIKTKKVRNGIYKDLALELAKVNTPEKYSGLPAKKWAALVERVYSDKKRKGFKFQHLQPNTSVNDGEPQE